MSAPTTQAPPTTQASPTSNASDQLNQYSTEAEVRKALCALQQQPHQPHYRMYFESTVLFCNKLLTVK